MGVAQHRCRRCGLWLLPANGGGWKHLANHHTGPGCKTPVPQWSSEYEADQESLADAARKAIEHHQGG